MFEMISSLISTIAGGLSVQGMALCAMFAAICLAFFEAQKRPDFDVGNFFKNETGKESVAALGAFVSLLLSGWTLIYVATHASGIDADTLVTIFTIFGCLWSGQKVAEKLIDALSLKWGGKPVTIEQPKQE